MVIFSLSFVALQCAMPNGYGRFAVFQALGRLLQSSRDVGIQVAESWGAILRANGFVPDFPIWWSQSEFRTSNAPEVCPI